MALASERETEEGSLRKEEAVFKAACFSAHVVPVAGAGAGAGEGEAAVERLEKRDESPEIEPEFATGWLEAPLGSSAHGLSWSSSGADGFPMPNPGTFTPAFPNLLTAPSWLANILRLAGGTGGCFC